MVTQMSVFSSFYSFTENIIFSFDNFTENFQIRQRPDLSPSELAGLAWGVVQRKRQVNANYTNAKTKTKIVQRQRHCSAVCGAYKEKDIKSFWMAKNVKYTYSACNCIPIFQVFGESSSHLCDCLLPQ